MVKIRAGSNINPADKQPSVQDEDESSEDSDYSDLNILNVDGLAYDPQNSTELENINSVDLRTQDDTDFPPMPVGTPPFNESELFIDEEWPPLPKNPPPPSFSESIHYNNINVPLHEHQTQPHQSIIHHPQFNQYIGNSSIPNSNQLNNQFNLHHIPNMQLNPMANPYFNSPSDSQFNHPTMPFPPSQFHGNQIGQIHPDIPFTQNNMHFHLFQTPSLPGNDPFDGRLYLSNFLPDSIPEFSNNPNTPIIPLDSSSDNKNIRRHQHSDLNIRRMNRADPLLYPEQSLEEIRNQNFNASSEDTTTLNTEPQPPLDLISKQKEQLETAKVLEAEPMLRDLRKELVKMVPAKLKAKRQQKLHQSIPANDTDSNSSLPKSFDSEKAPSKLKVVAAPDISYSNAEDSNYDNHQNNFLTPYNDINNVDPLLKISQTTIDPKVNKNFRNEQPSTKNDDSDSILAFDYGSDGSENELVFSSEQDNMLPSINQRSKSRPAVPFHIESSREIVPKESLSKKFSDFSRGSGVNRSILENLNKKFGLGNPFSNPKTGSELTNNSTSSTFKTDHNSTPEKTNLEINSNVRLLGPDNLGSNSTPPLLVDQPPTNEKSNGDEEYDDFIKQVSDLM
ncbi:hypothetical protein AYI68_g7612 [Smittium mucronatum]|uniref:Uncharacterized protein n=1 Tax=Smittium mucronatum TaxID=133383 RepID=A0A1R0GN65_9FUNG|nr:hypothetical protein AYI68_g7612 [Smittium mucronatum]